jgi:2-haloacid dehalogenase
MQPRPSVIVFDVNETISDMAPLGGCFEDIGVPALLAKVWFAALLRDGFALTVAGDKETFGRLADGALRSLLDDMNLSQLPDDAVDHILSAFAGLSVHRDVPDGVRLLRRYGLRLVTLSNGSTEVAANLLAKAGIDGEFERLLSVDDAPAWKPARSAYDYAARACSVDIGQMLLIAVHPWDIHGAHQAGMRTGWIVRKPLPYPAYFARPDAEATDLIGLARQIVA